MTTSIPPRHPWVVHREWLNKAQAQANWNPGKAVSRMDSDRPMDFPEIALPESHDRDEAVLKFCKQNGLSSAQYTIIKHVARHNQLSGVGHLAEAIVALNELIEYESRIG